MMHAPLPRLETRRYGAGTARHRHPFHQIVLPRTGEMRIDIDGREGLLGRQRAAFIPAGAPHAFEARGAHDFLILDLPREPRPRPGTGALDQLAQTVFFPLTPALDQLIAYAAGFRDLRLPDPAAWVALLIATAAPGRPEVPSGAPTGALARARAHIEAHLGAPLGVAQIARAAGTSERVLHRLFRAGLGCAPHGYLARRRAERALDLLARTPLSIAEIAHLTGHADQSALTRALKRQLGVTPAAYRRQQR